MSYDFTGQALAPLRELIDPAQLPSFAEAISVDTLPSIFNRFYNTDAISWMDGKGRVMEITASFPYQELV